MTMTTRIFGPGLPKEGRVIRDQLSALKLTEFLEPRAQMVNLAGGGTYLFHGGMGCPVTFVRAEEQEPAPTRVSVAKTSRG